MARCIYRFTARSCAPLRSGPDLAVHAESDSYGANQLPDWKTAIGLQMVLFNKAHGKRVRAAAIKRPGRHARPHRDAPGTRRACHSPRHASHMLVPPDSTRIPTRGLAETPICRKRHWGASAH